MPKKKMIQDKKTGKMRELRPYEREDGRFMRLITIGKNPDGSSRRLPVYGTSRADLDRNIAEIQYKLNRNIPVVTEHVTVKAYAQKWLDVYKKNVGYDSRRLYQNVIDHHLYELAEMEMRAVLPIHIQEYLNTFAESILESTGRHPSKSLLTKARSTLYQTFNKATLNHIVASNPVFGVDMPDAYVGDTRALTEQEQRWVTEVAKTHRFGPLVLSMLYAGLRRGEAIALTVDSIDTAAQKIRVRHAISFEGNKPKYGSPKTEAGSRDIPMNDVLLPVFSALTENIKANKIVSFTDRKNKAPALLFTTLEGSMMTAKAFNCGWGSFLHHVNLLARKEKNAPLPLNKNGNPDKRLKVPVIIDNITPHMLRHTYATLLCEAGIQLKTAQVWFGHSDVKLLMRVYADLRDEQDEREAQKLNAFLNSDTSRCSQTVVKGNADA